MNQNVSMLDNFEKLEIGNFINAGFFSLRCCDKNQITGWARKKLPLLKIHSIKSKSRIWMIRFLVKSRKIKAFLWFLSLSEER